MSDLGERVVLYYFDCPECGYDSDEAKKLAVGVCSGICPLCAWDTGRDVELNFRPATDVEIALYGKKRSKP
jgi:hypothetical protein